MKDVRFYNQTIILPAEMCFRKGPVIIDFVDVVQCWPGDGQGEGQADVPPKLCPTDHITANAIGSGWAPFPC